MSAFRSPEASPDLAEASDEDLLFWYHQSKSKEAIAMLWDRYRKDLFGYLRSCTVNEADADDLLQMTFVRVLTRCGEFDFASRKVRSWIFTIAYRLMIDDKRDHIRHPTVSIDSLYDEWNERSRSLQSLLSDERESTAEEKVIVAERECAVRKAIATLNTDLRNAVDLVVYQDMKYREAADALRIPIGTVKTRVRNATLTIAELLAEHPDFAPGYKRAA